MIFDPNILYPAIHMIHSMPYMTSPLYPRD